MGITTAGIASVIGLVGGLNHYPIEYLVMFVASGVTGSAAGLMVLLKRLGGMSSLSVPKRTSKGTPDPKSAVKNSTAPAKVVPPKVTQTTEAKPQPKQQQPQSETNSLFHHKHGFNIPKQQQPQSETPSIARPVVEPAITSPVVATGGSLVTDIRTMKTQLQRIEWRLEQVSRLIGVDPMEAEPPMMEQNLMSESSSNVQSTKTNRPQEHAAPPAQTASPTDNPSAEMIHSIAVSKSSSPFVKVPMPDESNEGKEEVSTKTPQVVTAAVAKKSDSNEKRQQEITVSANTVEQQPGRKAADHDIIDYSDQLRELNQLKQELLRLRSGLLTKIDRN
jgi:hypothetical protein